MGEDSIRHLLLKICANGSIRYFWNPSATLRKLGLTPEPLGDDYNKAKSRALELNSCADELRRVSKQGNNGPAPGSLSRLVSDYKKSPEFSALKQRTQDDYVYYLEKIELDFGQLPVAALKARTIKEYYRRLVAEKSLTWAYHIISTIRILLSWAVSEEWISHNPALSVRIKSPKKRTVTWQSQQTETLIAQAKELKWLSLAAMFRVYDCIGQSPIDIRTLRAGDYNGEAIASTRAKTGVSDAPIPLWPNVIAALDEYLATRPSLHPDAPLFAHDDLGGFWKESTLAKTFALIRKKAGLPSHLQMQDWRRTAATEAGASGSTVDEIRALQRHSTRTAALHYVHPDDRYVAAAQQKRLEQRNKTLSQADLTERKLDKSQNDRVQKVRMADPA